MNVTDSNLLTQVDIQSRDERSLAYLVGKRSWNNKNLESFVLVRLGLSNIDTIGGDDLDITEVIALQTELSMS